MKQKVITLLILIIAFIHIIPILGFIGVLKLESLYGIVINDNNLEILMRHRAVLFGILGVFFTYAAFKPNYQPLTFVAAFVSLASFFYLAFSIGDYNQAINKVIVADVVAAICWGIAVGLYFFKVSE